VKYQQYGGTLITALVLLVGITLILSCYDPQRLPQSIRDMVPKPSGSYSAQSNQGVYIPPLDSYAVQVIATRSKEEAYSHQRALQKDGYPAHVEMDRYTGGVIYYKVRIGAYETRQLASRVRNRILANYVKHFNDSFVYHY
jgi:cell division septation protein DedD